MLDDMLRVALPKGRISQEAIQLLRQSGYPVPEDIQETRKLVISVPDVQMEFILAKPMDVPTYVEYGVADVGIVGKDVLMEVDRDLYELLDLGISPCRISVAGLADQPKTSTLMPRIASKYPNIAERYFREKGQQVEVIFLNGSVELAPIIGLAEKIVDIVSTGQTLRENGLVELETIATVTSRLVANRVSYRMKGKSMDTLMERLEKTGMMKR